MTEKQKERDIERKRSRQKETEREQKKRYLFLDQLTLISFCFTWYKTESDRSLNIISVFLGSKIKVGIGQILANSNRCFKKRSKQISEDTQLKKLKLKFKIFIASF